jgi:hypothetical protein
MAGLPDCKGEQIFDEEGDGICLKCRYPVYTRRKVNGKWAPMRHPPLALLLQRQSQSQRKAGSASHGVRRTRTRANRRRIRSRRA